MKLPGQALVLLTLLCGLPALRGNPLHRYEYRRPEMGVPFRLVLFAADVATANRAADAAFNRVQQLNDILSDYEADSELSRLSRTSGQGLEVPVSPEFWFVLSRAQALARESDGSFDLTVGPCVVLWRRARRQLELPDPARLEQARRAVGYQHVRLNARRRSAELLVPNMRLDPGGIGKGYAIDEALRILKGYGIRSALVEGGGDVIVGDPPPGRPAWRVELSSVDATNAPASRYLLLKHAAISTSGDLYQRLEIEGKRYSHIVDPHTGIGLTDHSVVNVIAPNGITADSLTKVVSVLGPEKGLEFIERKHGVAARTMREIKGRVEVRESRRFAAYYEHR